MYEITLKMCILKHPDCLNSKRGKEAFVKTSFQP